MSIVLTMVLSLSSVAFAADSSLNAIKGRNESAAGVTKIVWGPLTRFQLFLDDEISRNVATGAGVAGALSGLIPEPAVSKVLGILFGVSSALIQHNNKGRGVILSGVCNPVPPFTPTIYWIKSQ